MTRASLLAAARISGWHREIGDWRILARAGACIASVESMRRAYVLGARHRVAGGACGCEFCAEVAR